MIIFGIRGGKRNDHGPALPVTCPNCNNQTFYRYLTVTKWFTLFFIPVVPISSKHYLMCPVCTRATELDRPGREHAAKLVELTTALQSGGMDADTYAERLRELGAPTGSLPPAAPPGALPPPPV
jgi:zinc ribbon protein